MACACKNRGASKRQPTAVKQVVKKPVLSSSAPAKVSAIKKRVVLKRPI